MDRSLHDLRSSGHSFLTFGPEFHMYPCMHVFARLIASHRTVKVHDVTAKHCAIIDQGHAPEKDRLSYSHTSPKVSTTCPKGKVASAKTLILEMFQQPTVLQAQRIVKR